MVGAGSFGGARFLPYVEALQRIDRQDAQAARPGGTADFGGRRAIEQRDAREVIADLDPIDAKLAREIEERRMVHARRDHVVH